MIIETTIEIFDRNVSELMGVELLSPVRMAFKTEDVTAVRETIDDGQEVINPNKCVIYMASGESFIIYYPYNEIIKHLKTV